MVPPDLFHRALRTQRSNARRSPLRGRQFAAGRGTLPYLHRRSVALDFSAGPHATNLPSTSAGLSRCKAACGSTSNPPGSCVNVLLLVGLRMADSILQVLARDSARCFENKPTRAHMNLQGPTFRRINLGPNCRGESRMQWRFEQCGQSSIRFRQRESPTKNHRSEPTEPKKSNAALPECLWLHWCRVSAVLILPLYAHLELACTSLAASVKP